MNDFFHAQTSATIFEQTRDTETMKKKFLLMGTDVRQQYLKEMLEQQMFGRIVLLEKAENGRRRFHIYDENLEKIC